MVCVRFAPYQLHGQPTAAFRACVKNLQRSGHANDGQNHPYSERCVPSGGRCVGRPGRHANTERRTQTERHRIHTGQTSNVRPEAGLDQRRKLYVQYHNASARNRLRDQQCASKRQAARRSAAGREGDTRGQAFACIRAYEPAPRLASAPVRGRRASPERRDVSEQT